MDTQAQYPTHTYPNTINDDTDDSQFNIPWDPTRDDLTMIVSNGYSELNATAKSTYKRINDLVRDGETKISAKRITETQSNKLRTTFNALKDLEEAGLISRNRKGIITLQEPDARNRDFRAYIASTR